MVHVVWLKRDLRLHDHKPLVEALRYGEPILPLYVAEPSIWQGGDLSERHFHFVKESLSDLQHSYDERGGNLFVAIGEMEDMLNILEDAFGDFTIHVHEEYGTEQTRNRNVRVSRWMEEKGLSFIEYPSLGIQQDTKKSFRQNWSAYMKEEQLPVPERIHTVEEEDVPSILSSKVDKLNRLSPSGTRIKYGQQGGESLALDDLQTFLEERCSRYETDLSNPLASFNTCSRLSAYLAWGNISMRHVVQRTNAAMTEDGNHTKQLKAFRSRLYWHGQCMKQLMEYPSLPTSSVQKELDAVRKEWEEETFERWCKGETGIPMIDAAMRSLLKTGWLNARSRAMLVSFICNTLLMDWRRPAHYLAQQFLDYEPAIHYSEMQRLAGTFGEAEARIYNPIQEGKKHDPDGAFVRRYVPVLKDVPNKYVHEPWKYDGFFHLHYVEPVVDVKNVNKVAKQVLNKMDGRSRRAKGNQHKTERREKDGTEQLSFGLLEGSDEEEQS
ncbi:FAD-binding domain-containing protein [Pontibacillus salicampi]|uniref:FAD-binding domain-containing protein n=1 Tax=Pontibacillus salicampi TaxID=1449801 RepID=A0ABV6LUB6_9BACI